MMVDSSDSYTQLNDQHFSSFHVSPSAVAPAQKAEEISKSSLTDEFRRMEFAKTDHQARKITDADPAKANAQQRDRHHTENVNQPLEEATFARSAQPIIRIQTAFTGNEQPEV